MVDRKWARDYDENHDDYGTDQIRLKPTARKRTHQRWWSCACPPAALDAAKQTILAPISLIFSRPALRAYLTTIIVTLASFILFGLAIVAYVLFYWSYVPRIGFERSIHLQFDNVYTPHSTLARHAHPYPYGTVSLTPDLIAQQAYDVWVEIQLPRTADNQDAGNFMLSVEMYGAEEKGKGNIASTLTTGNVLAPLRAEIGSVLAKFDTATVLASSRRSAILPYRSYGVDVLHKLAELPYYILGLRREEVQLRVPVFERVSFSRGVKNIPSTLKLEIQSTHRLQIYSAKALFRARFTGIRWLLYNHRIISAFLFVSSFWITELLFAGLAWVSISMLLAQGSQLKREIKADALHDAATHVKSERDDDTEPALSDKERTFPTLSGQPPLRYTSPTRDIKLEPGDDEAAILLPEAVVRGADADVEDEDEEDVDFFDSGIGTSLESSGPARRESLRRRRGRPDQRTLTPGKGGGGEGG